MIEVLRGEGSFTKWSLALASCLLMVWALWPYPQYFQKSPQEHYLLHFSFLPCLKFLLGFYGLYVLPGLFLFWRLGKKFSYNPFFTVHRFFLAFLLGAVAHVVAVLLQKFLSWPYQVWSVLLCLSASYALISWLLRRLRFLWEETPSTEAWGWVTWPVLALAFLLGSELILRGRASSNSIQGDAFAHTISLLATLIDGPLPDANPFFSTFILNIHPQAYHAMMATLVTLFPSLETLDVIRYFSLVFFPCFLLCSFAFFSRLAQSAPLGALCTLAMYFISGGGMSTHIPIAFFPWYWAMAWILSFGVVYFLIGPEWKIPVVPWVCGGVMGAGVLLSPMLAYRMGAIVALFFIFEGVRVLWRRESLKSWFCSGMGMALACALPVMLWLLPLILRYGWEQTYSYEYLIQNFSASAPRGIAYIKGLKETDYTWIDLWTWTRDNAGYFPLIFFPLGCWGLLRNLGERVSMLVLAWIVAMGAAILGGYLTNPYRYFEYFFLGLLMACALGLGKLFQIFPWKTLLLFLVFAVLILDLRLVYPAKYREAMEFYGRTAWTDAMLKPSRAWEAQYRRGKRQGTLDQDFGWYRGYLWSRQKKVWDIYLKYHEGPGTSPATSVKPR